MKFTDKQLIYAFEDVYNFDGWPKRDFVMIWVRSDADAFNRFDDKWYLYDGRGNSPKYIMKGTGTTNPGAGALLNFMRYNPKGAAVMKSNHINYQGHKHGRHKRDRNSYRQAKEIPHHRDNDRDRNAEELGPVYTKIIYMNIHKAGWFSKFIGWWSAGCLVLNQRAQWRRFIRYMNKMGNPFITSVVLNEGEIQ